MHLKLLEINLISIFLYSKASLPETGVRKELTSVETALKQSRSACKMLTKQRENSVNHRLLLHRPVSEMDVPVLYVIHCKLDLISVKTA